VLQNQVNTTNLSEYDWLFNNAKAQALAANPGIVVDSELSTNYGTPTQMATAAKSRRRGRLLSLDHQQHDQPDHAVPPEDAGGWLLTGPRDPGRACAARHGGQRKSHACGTDCAGRREVLCSGIGSCGR